MSPTMLSWAATLPVNPAGTPASAVLSTDALYASLVDKALDPAKYVAVIESCAVLSHDAAARVIVRDVVFRGAPRAIRERVTYTAPSVFVFEQLAGGGGEGEGGKQEQGKGEEGEGEVVGTVFNIISAGADGEVLLTFAFRAQSGGPMGFTELTPRDELVAAATAAVKGTIEAARKSLAA
ncbi:hypothetical protein Q5752_000844 [Cryptotrichosporon argae]